MDTSSLRNFVQLVPTCVQTLPLKTALVAWSNGAQGPQISPVAPSELPVQRSSGDRLVVVDQQHRPLGWLNLLKLLPSLLSESNPALTTATLSELLEQSDPVVEPLINLSVNLSLTEIWPYLQTAPHRFQPLGLVEESGCFVGLLDTDHLLQVMATQLREAPSAVPNGHGSSQTNRGQSSDRFAAPEITTPLPWMTALVNLLEQLPWPLRLQTNSGQVVAENPSWQTQVGQLIDPDRLTQQVAEQFDLERQEVASAQQFQSRALNTYPLDLQVGTCIAQVENGQASTWQFIKIPLPVKSLVSERDPSFRLANLSSPSTELSNLYGFTGDAPETGPLWLILLQDLTDQQQTAQELTAKNADLAELNRMKDEFLACISHELKTPLTAILGLTSVLKEKGIGDLSPRQDRYARLIYQSSRQLMTVINDILDLTRIETHQLELLPEPVDIRSICERVRDQVIRLHAEEMAETTKVDLAKRIQLEIQPGLDFFVADTLRLRQMLVHLLTNALKFTDASGSVGLEVSHWHGWLAFTVWDTGIGIPVEKQHLIFQKFQQLENSLSRRYPGIGLGLILAQRLARLHGGEVTFTSQENQGSQFTLLLPTCPPEPLPPPTAVDLQGFSTPAIPMARSAVQQPLPRQPQPLLTPGMILLVDTSPQALADLTQQLTASGAGYRIVIARSGTEAVEKARRLRPSLIILNPILPLLSGWDVLTLLKGNRKTAHIPIAVTAPVSEKRQVFQQGADGFLSVPVQAADLQNLLGQYGQIETPQATPTLSSQAESHPLPSQQIFPQRFTNLTVLRLEGEYASGCASGAATSSDELNDCSGSLPVAEDFCDRHLHDCHLLEATDIDQAELLARFWHPDVVLVAGDPSLAFFEALSQHAALGSLPLITLTSDATRAASQVPGLAVFPVSDTALSTQTKLDSSVLLEVLQSAAGLDLKPTILTLDAGAALAVSANHSGHSPVPALNGGANPLQARQWLPAFNQYLQAAGFKVVQGASLIDLQGLIALQNIHLVLISLQGQAPSLAFKQCLQDLRNTDTILPIWLLNGPAGKTDPEFLAFAKTLHLKILPPTTAIPDLVRQLHQVCREDNPT